MVPAPKVPAPKEPAQKNGKNYAPEAPFLSPIEMYDEKRYSVIQVNDFMKRVEKDKLVFADMKSLDTDVVQKLNYLHYSAEGREKGLHQLYKATLGQKYINIKCTQKGCQYQYWLKFQSSRTAGASNITYERVIKRLHNKPYH